MKDDRVYVRHILDAAEKIGIYTRGMTREEFSLDEKTRDAVERKLEIIGEAAKRLTLEFIDRSPEIPWRLMARMRDKLIHHYMGVEIKTVWDTAKEDISPLVEKLRIILEKLEKSRGA